MRAASVTGYLSPVLLALFLAGCSSEDSEQPVAELITADDETSASAASPAAEESFEATSKPAASAADCQPTQPDMLGPYYVPGAPARNSVDTGYVMSGEVLSAEGCEPIPGAQIEVWLAGPWDDYDDAHRATMLAGEQGEYRSQSNFPGPYENRPPHIHVGATAPGFRELITQYYPEAGQTEATFDLVLEPL